MTNLIEFFKALYRRCSLEGQIEFRFIPSRKRIFIPLADLKLPAFPKDQNIYFGVATRDGYGGSKNNLEQIPALWIDFDRKRIPEREFKDKFKIFQLKPSIIVETGGGSHLYWLLKKPATKADIPWIEALLRNMASYFETDLAATDSSRILRVPGTSNIKYKPPRPVTLKKIDSSLEYDLRDFDFFLDKETEVRTSEIRSSSGWPHVILKGVPEGERNFSAARLAGRYFKRGLLETEVLGFLSAWNQKNRPPLSEAEIEKTVRSVARSIVRRKVRNRDN